LSDGGNGGYQQHREKNLLHSCGSLTLRGKLESTSCPAHASFVPGFTLDNDQAKIPRILGRL
jgi:hypothetical protein